jgi:hypothetical protein
MKTHWNYRIVKEKIVTPIKEFTSYAIKEVYWEGKKVVSYTAEPIGFVADAEDGETDEEMKKQLIESLLQAVKSITENPIVDVDSLPKKK